MKKLNKIFSSVVDPYDLIKLTKSLDSGPLKVSLHSILLLGVGNSKVYDLEKIKKAYNFIYQFIDSIEIYKGESYCFLEDSRQSSLLDRFISVGLLRLLHILMYLIIIKIIVPLWKSWGGSL